MGDPAATFKDDIDAAREAISSETNQGRNVVVLAHSYGGMVGNNAIKGFTRPQDATAPTTGYVIRLVLIASGFTLTGLSFMDPFFGRPPPSWRVNGETGYAELVALRLTPQSLKALFEGDEHAYAGWKDVPVWHIGTVEDRGLPVLVQRVQVGMAREMGGSVEHGELQTSHSPFLSQPDVTARIILEAVEAFTGKQAGNESTMSGRGDAISVPMARLWQPFTWFRFGLPMAFERHQRQLFPVIPPPCDDSVRTAGFDLDQQKGTTYMPLLEVAWWPT
ncbi:hypothetical protein IFM51744_01381 [Aspergillus udagawae]|nr:hypothetical protein IFM51744_01381 [Aspergillus udagawae]